MYLNYLKVFFYIMKLSVILFYCLFTCSLTHSLHFYEIPYTSQEKNMFLTGNILKQSIINAYINAFILQFDSLLKPFWLLEI